MSKEKNRLYVQCRDGYTISIWKANANMEDDMGIFVLILFIVIVIAVVVSAVSAVISGVIASEEDDEE